MYIRRRVRVESAGQEVKTRVLGVGGWNKQKKGGRKNRYEVPGIRKDKNVSCPLFLMI